MTIDEIKVGDIMQLNAFGPEMKVTGFTADGKVRIEWRKDGSGYVSDAITPNVLLLVRTCDGRATPIGDGPRARPGNCHKCGAALENCACVGQAFTAPPGVRILAPNVYVVSLDESYTNPTPEQVREIEDSVKARLPSGAVVLVTSPGMTIRQLTPPAAALVHIHDDLYLDAARVVSVEAFDDGPVLGGLPCRVEIVCAAPAPGARILPGWDANGDHPWARTIAMPNVFAARELAAAITDRVNRARQPDRPVFMPPGTKFTPLMSNEDFEMMLKAGCLTIDEVRARAGRKPLPDGKGQLPANPNLKIPRQPNPDSEFVPIGPPAE